MKIKIHGWLALGIVFLSSLELGAAKKIESAHVARTVRIAFEGERENEISIGIDEYGFKDVLLQSVDVYSDRKSQSTRTFKAKFLDTRGGDTENQNKNNRNGDILWMVCSLAEGNSRGMKVTWQSKTDGSIHEILHKEELELGKEDPKIERSLSGAQRQDENAEYFEIQNQEDEENDQEHEPCHAVETEEIQAIPPPPTFSERATYEDGGEFFPNCYTSDAEYHILEIGIVTDVATFQKQKGKEDQVRTLIEDVVASASAFYEVQFNFELKIKSLLIATDTNNNNNNNEGQSFPSVSRQDQDSCMGSFSAMLSNMKDWSSTLSADEQTSHWAFFTGCQDGQGSLGVAYVDSLSSSRFNVGVNHVGKNGASNSPLRIFTHELAHGVGAGHSFENGKGDTGGLMDYGNGKLLTGTKKIGFRADRRNEMCTGLNRLKYRNSPFFRVSNVGPPTDSPTKSPTKNPTPKPTESPSRKPTKAPTRKPTRKPTPEPTNRPTKAPSRKPTSKPTRTPTQKPTRTEKPTRAPRTPEPTGSPTSKPTRAPSKRPTRKPTPTPTRRPTRPTKAPTNRPTIFGETYSPTSSPTLSPSTASPTTFGENKTDVVDDNGNNQPGAGSNDDAGSSSGSAGFFRSENSLIIVPAVAFGGVMVLVFFASIFLVRRRRRNLETSTVAVSFPNAESSSTPPSMDDDIFPEQLGGEQFSSFRPSHPSKLPVAVSVPSFPPV